MLDDEVPDPVGPLAQPLAGRRRQVERRLLEAVDLGRRAGLGPILLHAIDHWSASRSWAGIEPGATLTAPPGRVPAGPARPARPGGPGRAPARPWPPAAGRPTAPRSWPRSSG